MIPGEISGGAETPDTKAVIEVTDVGIYSNTKRE